MVRAFEDGDFVFAHMEYDFSSVKVAFEVFRFENGFAVEHWDNIQSQIGPTSSGRDMLDGNIESKEIAKTEDNRALVKDFVDTVIIKQKIEKLGNFVNAKEFIQHSPKIADGIEALRLALLAKSPTGFKIKYSHLHRVLAEGSFVLSVSEGWLDDVQNAFYDLYRVEDNKLVEHWDTIEAIPPMSEWKNINGKF